MADLLPLLADAEKVTSLYLRSVPEVVDIVDDRVWTELPARRKGGSDAEWRFPSVRITRIGGAPVVERPLMLDAPILQLDCWGGPKALAVKLGETCRAALAVAHLDHHDDAIVYGATFGDLLYLPDDTFAPAKPRTIFDVTLTLRPRAGTGS